MKTEIIANKERATFQAKREFNPNVSLVWKAFTGSEMLDQWWAPKPWEKENGYGRRLVNGTRQFG